MDAHSYRPASLHIESDVVAAGSMLQEGKKNVKYLQAASGFNCLTFTNYCAAKRKLTISSKTTFPVNIAIKRHKADIDLIDVLVW